MTNNFLVNYAVENFWCNPQQDKQAIFKIARLTPVPGVSQSVKVLERYMVLPTTSDTYHVFQIGQLSPFYLNLIGQNPIWSYDDWTSIGDSIAAQNIFADIYNSDGIHIPRFEVFYRFTLTRDLIVAIKENKNIPVQYGTDDIYFRVYSNAYFNMSTVNNANDMFYFGTTALSTQAVLDAQTLYAQYAAMTGYCFAYCNGFLIDSISLVTVPAGSTIEFIYDSSVKRIFMTPMQSVQSFVSILDQQRKYLLHDSAAANTTINYQDDIEIYIILPQAGHYSGVYYHRNGPGAYRMVTHRDYAINVNYATALMQSFQTLSSTPITSFNQLYFFTVVRRSGFNHSLVFENNRVQELYKLTDTQVVQAMVGLNSTNPIWQAPNLENSLYTQVMRAYPAGLSPTLVQNALGYNALSKIEGDTPSTPYNLSGQTIADVPAGLQSFFCAYEYDSQGYLLGYVNNLSGSQYVVQNASCAQVEMLYGQGGNTAPAYFSTTGSVTIPSNVNYRVYTSSILNTGLSNNIWTDITGNGSYTVTNNVLTLNTANSGLMLQVRTDERIVNYDLDLNPQDGLLSFTLSEMQNRDGNLQNYTQTVPMRDLALFLNGQSLVESIDYIVVYPQVVITNTNALIQPANNNVQKIHVRFSGFCNPDLTYEQPSDTGFIANGAFSNNYRYDIMDDAVIRLVVGGRYLTRAQLQVDNDQAGVLVSTAYNGQPYSLSNPLIPIQGLLGTDLMSFVQASESIDIQVKNYLSTFLPKASAPLQSIPALYRVLSPFICKLIYQLVNNEASNIQLVTPTMSDNDVIAFCKPYESWLAFDPINLANTIDSRFVSIVPINSTSAVQLPLAQYRLVMRAIALYAKNPMASVSSYIQLKPL
jgi:hypothetical protein